jgi:hypothetical protein
MADTAVDSIAFSPVQLSDKGARYTHSLGSRQGDLIRPDTDQLQRDRAL